MELRNFFLRQSMWQTIPYEKVLTYLYRKINNLGYILTLIVQNLMKNKGSINVRILPLFFLVSRIIDFIKSKLKWGTYIHPI